MHYRTLSLNISASRQNIKNLVGIFGAIYVRIMHANFQAFSSTGVGEGGGDRRKDGHGTSGHFWLNPYTKFLNSPLHFALGEIENGTKRVFLNHEAGQNSK